MVFERPVLVIFHGGVGDGEAERVMARARVAAGRSTARAALAAGFEAVIVATDDVEAWEPAGPGLLVDADSRFGDDLRFTIHDSRFEGTFSFENRLRGLVARYG